MIATRHLVLRHHNCPIDDDKIRLAYQRGIVFLAGEISGIAQTLVGVWDGNVQNPGYALTIARKGKAAADHEMEYHSHLMLSGDPALRAATSVTCRALSHPPSKKA